MEKNVEAQHELENRKKKRKKLKHYEYAMVVFLSAAFTAGMMQFEHTKGPDNTFLQGAIIVMAMLLIVVIGIAFVLTQGDIENYLEEQITKKQLTKYLAIKSVVMIIAIYLFAVMMALGKDFI